MKKYNDVQFVDNIKQPNFKKYVNPKLISQATYEDNIELPKKTKVDTHIIDVAVNCLTKYLISSSIKASFRVPLLGAKLYAYRRGNNKDKYQEILNGLTLINGLNKQSIYVAINIAQFEKLFSKAPIIVSKCKRIDVDEETYDLITKLINRNLRFFEDHGPVGKISFDFIDGKPEVISNASLDFVTRDGLWNLETTKKVLSEQQIFLMLVHYIMFLHSPEAHELTIRTLGVFDSRSHKCYTLQTKDISIDALRKVEKILGYENCIFNK